MNLTDQQLRQLATAALAAARAAGRFVSETRPAEVQRKAGGDSLASQVVTEVDRQSQTIILEILQPTFAAYDLALLTEELPDDGSRLEKDYFWCIDPVDGTLPFIEGVPGYAVSIALIARDGTPVIGVVFDPVEQMLYHAILGLGAYCDNAPLKLPEAGPVLQVFTDRSTADQPWLEESARRLGVEKVTAHGGGVMNALWVLANPPACYFKFPRSGKGGGSPWDFAATACIFHEVGAIATDIYGNPLDLNRPDSTFMNHRGILFASDADLAARIQALYPS